MALSDILEKIREEAGEKVDRMREQSRQEVESILAEARREAEKTEASIVEHHENKLKEELERDISLARLKARKEILTMKRDLVAGIYDSIPEVLLEQPSSEYAEQLAEFVDRDALSMPAELQVGRREIERYGEGFPSLLGELLKKNHPGAQLKALPDPGPFSQGFVIRSEKVVHNLSLDSLIVEARSRASAETARALFNE